MDLKLGKEDLEHSLENFEEFKNCKRSKDQQITKFM